MHRVTFLLFSAALISCSGEEDGASPTAASGEPKATAAASVAPLELALKAIKIEPFVYRSDGVRDPFQPFIVSLDDRNRSDRCPLCVPLSNLEFTGVVTGIASPVALIETREGVGYFIRRGSELGSNGGRVIDIREGVILLRERFQDQLGRISVVDRTLRIRTTANAPSKDEVKERKKSEGVEEPTEEERVKKTTGPADEL